MEYTMDEVLDAAERVEKESEAEHDEGANVMTEGNADGDEEIAEEDVNTVGKDLDDFMDNDLNTIVDGGASTKPGVTAEEGETPVCDSEGVTPIVDIDGVTLGLLFLEGKPLLPLRRRTLSKLLWRGTTVKDVSEGEIPKKVVEGETPVKVVSEGETPEKVVEGETHNVAEELTTGGLQFIVDLVNEPESDEAPEDERLTRRHTRRSILDEINEPTGTVALNLGGQRTRAREVVPEESGAETRRLAIECKRKGKYEAREPPRRNKKNTTAAPPQKLMEEEIKVPFAKAQERQAAESETEEETNFGRPEVWVTKSLLETMETFDDPKWAQTYKKRSMAGKLVKSGKRYDAEALRDIESDNEFLSYI